MIVVLQHSHFWPASQLRSFASGVESGVEFSSLRSLLNNVKTVAQCSSGWNLQLCSHTETSGSAKQTKQNTTENVFLSFLSPQATALRFSPQSSTFQRNSHSGLERCNSHRPQHFVKVRFAQEHISRGNSSTVSLTVMWFCGEEQMDENAKAHWQLKDWSLDEGETAIRRVVKVSWEDVHRDNLFLFAMEKLELQDAMTKLQNTMQNQLFQSMVMLQDGSESVDARLRRLERPVMIEGEGKPPMEIQQRVDTVGARLKEVEQDVARLVSEMTSHVRAVSGELACFEATKEAWLKMKERFRHTETDSARCMRSTTTGQQEMWQAIAEDFLTTGRERGGHRRRPQVSSNIPLRRATQGVSINVVRITIYFLKCCNNCPAVRPNCPTLSPPDCPTVRLSARTL